MLDGASNSRKNNAGGAREAVNNRGNSAGGTRKAVYNKSNSAGGTREVVYNMRISAEGARDCDNRNNSISGANEAVPTGATGLGAKRLLEGSTGGGMKAAYNRRNKAEVPEKLLATGTA